MKKDLTREYRLDPQDISDAVKYWLRNHHDQSINEGAHIEFTMDTEGALLGANLKDADHDIDF